MRKATFFLASLLALGVHGSAQALTVTVDGDLSEWGVTMANGVSGGVGSTYVSVPGITADDEDTNDTSNSYTVGPNQGGQNYDWEYLGATIQSGDLYIGVMSGQRPDNGFTLFSPGDIRITTTYGRTFGIEVGGGAGNGTGAGNFTESSDSRGINASNLGSFYGLNGSGYTATHTYSSAHVVAGLYETTGVEATAWYTELVGGLPNTQSQLQLLGGTYKGTADYIFRWTSGSVHATIELGIDMSAFDLAAGDVISTISWQPSCGNDLGTIGTPGTQVPEPATIALALLSAGAVATVRRASSFA